MKPAIDRCVFLSRWLAMRRHWSIVSTCKVSSTTTAPGGRQTSAKTELSQLVSQSQLMSTKATPAATIKEENDSSPSQSPLSTSSSSRNNVDSNNDGNQLLSSNSFDYESRFDELIERKKSDNSYRVFRRLYRFSDRFPHGLERGRPVTVWCSNDYFGMSSHPIVRQAAIEAAQQYGTGSGGTRNIAGNSPLHLQLEQELADLHAKEAALLFSSCYVANESTLYTLSRLLPNCIIYSDAGNHASMIQGIRTSGVQKHIFRTFDPQHLETLLAQAPPDQPKIVAFETVHSMTGDVSPVERMCDVAHAYGALTFVDEVHAVGLYGEHGAGIGQRDRCADKIDIVSGTLGKAYGNFGGYIASNSKLVDTIRCYASAFIFTTSLPPTVVSGARASVRLLKGPEGRELRARLQHNVLHMKRSLTAAGLPHLPSKSHIIPVPVGDAGKCAAVSSDLLEQHAHYIQSINYPTVPIGTERLRISLTPYHNETMIDDLIERLVSVWSANQLSFLPSVEFISNCGHTSQLARQQQQQQQVNTTPSTNSIRQGIGEPLWCHHCAKALEFISLNGPSTAQAT